jgi:hypothetical protein
VDFGYGEGKRTFFRTLDTLYWDALQLLTSVQNTHTCPFKISVGDNLAIFSGV